jgi:uncharacterized protein
MFLIAIVLVACSRSPAQVLSPGQRIVAGARGQLSQPADYTPGYFKLSYPNGDLPQDKGVCTDVVIRALRYAGYDLQVLIHEDMKRHFSTYPRRERRPDSNIDHRRVPNQMHFFSRYGRKLGNTADWRPGDFVYWKLDNGLDHAGVLSDAKGSSNWMVIHNLSRTAEEDVLYRWKVIGHYRYPR